MNNKSAKYYYKQLEITLKKLYDLYGELPAYSADDIKDYKELKKIIDRIIKRYHQENKNAQINR